MQPNEYESEYLEAMARYTQLLRGQLGVTEEILEHMHRITVTIRQNQTAREADAAGEQNQVDGQPA